MSRDFPAISADQEPYIGHYELLNTLGQGSFGKVTLGRHLLTGAVVAVKAICSQQGYFGFQSHQQEAECMAVLHHPHIVQLFEVIVTKNVFYLIMEHVRAGDLRRHLQIHGALPEQEARGIFRQLVSAVHHCHMKGIVHRDIKPSNVLLGPDMTVKLADFGLSVPFSKRKLSSFRGSRFYAAPEVFSARKYEGPPMDIWSLGVLLYKVVTGTLPFKENNLMELKKLILSVKYTVPSSLSSQLQHLLSKLLTLNPKKRSNLEDIMPDPWINMGEEEKLRPYNEPPSEGLDPCVTQKMVDMGFQFNWIQHALNNKTYDYIMATYLILKREKPGVQCLTIRVRPYSPPDLHSRRPSPPGEVQPAGSRQQREAQGTGRKVKDSAGLVANRTSRTASPRPSPDGVQDHLPQTQPRVQDCQSPAQPEEEGHSSTQPEVEDSRSPAQPGV